MKIGIMTFHWAPNYGAIIQAYALQSFLVERYECEVEIIDYYPERFEPSLKRVLSFSYPNVMIERYREYRRHDKLKRFREKYFKLSKHFSTTEELKKYIHGYEVLICGSDQIWNQAFTLDGENRFTTAYYLDFGGECKRIAYAVSFGCIEYPQEILDKLKPLLQSFDAISVREQTGTAIVRKIPNCSARVVCDPTVLPGTHFYTDLLKTTKNNGYSVTIYVLRHKPSELSRFAKLCAEFIGGSTKVIESGFLSMEDWLGMIYYSKLYITNSFHGMMLCLRLHRNFAVVLEKGILSGMNDRFLTVLSQVNLENHIINDLSEIEAKRICCSDINWKYVEEKITEMRKSGLEFLDNVLGDGHE